MTAFEMYWEGSVGASVDRSADRARLIGDGAEAIYAARLARARQVAAEMRAEGLWDVDVEPAQ